MIDDVIIRPEAEAELTRAYEWYEEQRHGLGDALLLSIDATISTIKRNPDFYPKIRKTIRRALVRRFPFGVYYTIRGSAVVVLAIFHARRNPLLLGKRH